MAIDPELLSSVRAHAATYHLRLLLDEEADEFLKRISDRFGFDASRTWWWEGAVGTESPYEDPANAVDKLGDVLRAAPDAKFYLAVTDDEPAPWPVIYGGWKELSKIIREERLFEFFIFDETMDRVVFDTHMTRLVVVEAEHRRSSVT